MTRQPDDIEFLVRRAGDDPFGDTELRATMGFTSQDIVNAVDQVRKGTYAPNQPTAFIEDAVRDGYKSIGPPNLDAGNLFCVSDATGSDLYVTNVAEDQALATAMLPVAHFTAGSTLRRIWTFPVTGTYILFVTAGDGSNHIYRAPVPSFTDGVANGTTTFTSATALFTWRDRNRTITIGGVANTIVSITNETTVVLANTVAAASGLTFKIAGRVGTFTATLDNFGYANATGTLERNFAANNNGVGLLCEYNPQPSSQDTHTYITNDDGQTFTLFETFVHAPQAGHIHSIQVDPDGVTFVRTWGDTDTASKIETNSDSLTTTNWTKFIAGADASPAPGQQSRTVMLLMTATRYIHGYDSPDIAESVVSRSKTNPADVKTLLADAQNTIYFAVQDSTAENARFFISTGSSPKGGRVKAFVGRLDGSAVAREVEVSDLLAQATQLNQYVEGPDPSGGFILSLNQILPGQTQSRLIRFHLDDTNERTKGYAQKNPLIVPRASMQRLGPHPDTVNGIVAIGDLSVTNGSTAVTAASAPFIPADVTPAPAPNLIICPALPSGTTITARSSATAATVSAAATGTTGTYPAWIFRAPYIATTAWRLFLQKFRAEEPTIGSLTWKLISAGNGTHTMQGVVYACNLVGDASILVASSGAAGTVPTVDANNEFNLPIAPKGEVVVGLEYWRGFVCSGATIQVLSQTRDWGAGPLSKTIDLGTSNWAPAVLHTASLVVASNDTPCLIRP